MKTAIISVNGAIKLDTDTLSITNIPGKSPSSIRDIYIADEDMHVIYEDNSRRYEADVKEGQLMAVFYRSITDKEDTIPVAIFDSEDWKNNIRIVDEDNQRQKEEWAKRNAPKQRATDGVKLCDSECSGDECSGDSVN